MQSDPDVNAWLIVAYSLPAEPSRKRVLVWRHLRKLGAVYLETGIWLLPHSDKMTQEVEPILREIHELGGTATAFLAHDFPGVSRQDLRQSYNNVRREEYADLLRNCDRFLSHIDRLVQRGDYKFANVEELEEDLEKRRRSLTQVIARDAFGMEERQTVEAAMRSCEEALTHFVEESSLHDEPSRL